MNLFSNHPTLIYSLGSLISLICQVITAVALVSIALSLAKPSK